MIKVEKNADDNYKITDHNGSTLGHYFVRENSEVMIYISASYGVLKTSQLIELLYEANKIEYNLNRKHNDE